MRSGGGSFSQLGLHIGQDWSTHLSTYPEHAPILTIGAGSTTVTVYITGTQATAAAVEFARDLAAQSAEFAAEMARIHAWQQAGGGSGSGTPDGEAA
jgi:GH24 family phage-related lysozyme (muramidase)